MAHAGAVDVIDAGDRAIFHRESEARLGFEPEREAKRGADRAAMRHRDDVATATGLEQLVDRAPHPLHYIHEAFPAGGALMRRRLPPTPTLTPTRITHLHIRPPP